MSSVVKAIKGLVVKNSTDSPLFESVKVGKNKLKTRLVYAPLTVSRACEPDI